MLTVTQHAEGNHFIIPLLRSFDISLSATSLTHKDEIGLGLFLSGARYTSTLLMAPSIGLCQSLFCSLQVTLTPFVGSVSLSAFPFSLSPSGPALVSFPPLPPPLHFLSCPPAILWPSPSSLIQTRSGLSTWISSRININPSYPSSLLRFSSFLFINVKVAESQLETWDVPASVLGWDSFTKESELFYFLLLFFLLLWHHTYFSRKMFRQLEYIKRINGQVTMLRAAINVFVHLFVSYWINLSL